LPSIRFVCLAMSEGYIENHYDEIIGHESEIESRFVNTDCTKDVLKEDNKRMVDGFERAGEQVSLIDSNYEQVIEKVLD
ncbi:MAG: adenylate kinase, partial [Clostridia bacterium]|nr:adenylate kinase [Clostridia bacterium]